MSKTEEQNKHAIDNAKCWLASIHEMAAALEPVKCEPCGRWHADGAKCDTELAGDKESDADDVSRGRITESALSVEVRSDWYETGAEPDASPSEFRILLTTGGPALRIAGDLSRGSVSNPRLEWQDWGTTWTRLETSGDDEDAMLAFCACFYFGD